MGILILSAIVADLPMFSLLRFLTIICLIGLLSALQRILIPNCARICFSLIFDMIVHPRFAISTYLSQFEVSLQVGELLFSA